MTITFADGTRIDVPASGFNDFLKHDLHWAEFVHGRVSKPELLQTAPGLTPDSAQQNIHRCPSGTC